MILALFVHELRNQQLLFWRNRESAVFVFVFPPMLFLLLGAVYDGTSTASRLPTVCSSGCSATGAPTRRFGGLAITLVIRRESGVLKRLRATPLPPATFLAAVLVSTLVVFVAADGADDRPRTDALRRARPGELARDRSPRCSSASPASPGWASGSPP